MPRPRYKEGEEPEFAPYAWATFERAVKAMAKAGPMHKPAAKPKAKRARKKKAR